MLQLMEARVLAVNHSMQVSKSLTEARLASQLLCASLSLTSSTPQPLVVVPAQTVLPTTSARTRARPLQLRSTTVEPPRRDLLKSAPWLGSVPPTLSHLSALVVRYLTQPRLLVRTVQPALTAPQAEEMTSNSALMELTLWLALPTVLSVQLVSIVITKQLLESLVATELTVQEVLLLVNNAQLGLNVELPRTTLLHAQSATSLLLGLTHAQPVEPTKSAVRSRALLRIPVLVKPLQNQELTNLLLAVLDVLKALNALDLLLRWPALETTTLLLEHLPAQPSSMEDRPGDQLQMVVTTESP